MRLIGIDEDVYRHIVRGTREVGETPSAILRRLLGIGAPGPRIRRLAVVAGGKRGSKRHELSAALDRTPWLPFEVQRYLYVLRCVQRLRPLDFRNIAQIRGRSRIYFARSAGEIEASGKSTHPRPLGDSAYWALTNLPGREKERILRNVLSMLQFDEQAMLAAREYLLRGTI